MKKVFLDRIEYQRDDGTIRIKYFTGEELHYVNGLLHREDGPAHTVPFKGEKYWVLNGRFHRMSGPAVTTNFGKKQFYFVNGIKISEKDFSPVQKAKIGEFFILKTFSFKLFAVKINQIKLYIFGRENF